MRIVVAGGREEADFLIGSLLTKKHKVKVINDDANYSKYLAEKYNITVLKGDSSKEYILDDADIYGYDVLIALTNDDADNFVTCLVAKKNFDIKSAKKKIAQGKRSKRLPPRRMKKFALSAPDVRACSTDAQPALPLVNAPKPASAPQIV